MRDRAHLSVASDPRYFTYLSDAVASRDAATIALLRVRGWTDARAADHPFSDDYSDLIRYLRLTN